MKTKKSKLVLAELVQSLDPNVLRRVGDRMVIATKIADAIKRKGLTQKEFAKIMGKTESEISDWLSGDRNFTIDTLSDIGYVLNIKLLDTNITKMSVTKYVSLPYSNDIVQSFCNSSSNYSCINSNRPLSIDKKAS